MLPFGVIHERRSSNGERGQRIKTTADEGEGGRSGINRTSTNLNITGGVSSIRTKLDKEWGPKSLFFIGRL